MHELGSWQAAGFHQLTDFTSSLTSRFSRCRAGGARITRAGAKFPGSPVHFRPPPYMKFRRVGAHGSLRRSGPPTARGFTPPYLLAAHRRPLLMASARHRTEWNQFAVGLPPAGVLGCPYPYRLVFACSTCSGVPP
ncbi:hypothetical protein D3C78_1021630 [compost metagenome]